MAQVVLSRGMRLVYFDQTATSGFWHELWHRSITLKSYEKSRTGYLGDFLKPFLEYLPKEGKILEAGCGLAKIVIALRARGYNCEGVELAERTVKEAKALFPDVPVRYGDVTQLEVPNAYYRGYISLGGIKHREKGPEPFLKEA